MLILLFPLMFPRMLRFRSRTVNVGFKSNTGGERRFHLLPGF